MRGSDPAVSAAEIPGIILRGKENRMHINIPEDVQFILKRLDRAGYEAYIVGGCTRDSILGKLPQDWDITTSAMPEQVKELFSRTIDTGIRHGTVTVMIGATGYEVTTYRIDGIYEEMQKRYHLYIPDPQSPPKGSP